MDNGRFSSENNGQGNDYWKMLVVDDDNYVHIMIKETLKTFKFEGKPITILYANSAIEALNVLSSNEDIALVMVDVYIKGKAIGLKLTRYIRDILGNLSVRIVLMTDSDSSRLQEEIILNYDINGFEVKHNFLTKKLYTILISSLRAYRDIMHINDNKKAMEQIVASSSKLFETDSITQFITSVFCHLSNIITFHKEQSKHYVNGIAAIRLLDKDSFKVVAGFGKYENSVGKTIMEALPKNDLIKVKQAYHMKNYIITKNRYISYYNSTSGMEGIIFIEIKENITRIDSEILDVFHKNISATFESLCINKEIEETQREILYILGELTEARSEETGNHVKRVSEYSKILAEKYGLSKREVMLIAMAAPIHDVGKVGISDNILMKPGKLTREEFEIVKTHATIGYNMLKSSNRELLKSAAIIAHEHHERYDGRGYPQGLKGEGIHIYGRIVGVADVFDALGSSRVYKKPWVMNDILNYFKDEKGKQFDPALVDILFDNLDEFMEIRKKYGDKVGSNLSFRM